MTSCSTNTFKYQALGPWLRITVVALLLASVTSGKPLETVPNKTRSNTSILPNRAIGSAITTSSTKTLTVTAISGASSIPALEFTSSRLGRSKYTSAVTKLMGALKPASSCVVLALPTSTVPINQTQQTSRTERSSSSKHGFTNSNKNTVSLLSFPTTLQSQLDGASFQPTGSAANTPNVPLLTTASSPLLSSTFTNQKESMNTIAKAQSETGKLFHRVSIYFQATASSQHTAAHPRSPREVILQTTSIPTITTVVVDGFTSGTVPPVSLALISSPVLTGISSDGFTVSSEPTITASTFQPGNSPPANDGFQLISEDSWCGPNSTVRATCYGSNFGDCCSASGYCGFDIEHCLVGCQPDFGTCGGYGMHPPTGPHPVTSKSVFTNTSSTFTTLSSPRSTLSSPGSSTSSHPTSSSAVPTITAPAVNNNNNTGLGNYTSPQVVGMSVACIFGLLFLILLGKYRRPLLARITYHRNRPTRPPPRSIPMQRISYVTDLSSDAIPTIMPSRQTSSAETSLKYETSVNSSLHHFVDDLHLERGRFINAVHPKGWDRQILKPPPNPKKIVGEKLKVYTAKERLKKTMLSGLKSSSSRGSRTAMNKRANDVGEKVAKIEDAEEESERKRQQRIERLHAGSQEKGKDVEREW